MYELSRDIISNPFIASSFVICLWGVFYLLFVKLFKLKKTTWIKLEYVWIIIGFLGVLSLIYENRKNFNIENLEQTELWIEDDFVALKSFLDNDIIHCVKYNNTGIFTQTVFDSIQARADSVCVWTNKVRSIIDSVYTSDKTIIITIPDIKILDPNSEYSFNRTNQIIDRLNSNIEKRDSLSIIINRQDWQYFRYGYGIILLILAFALRLTIISHKVHNEKNHMNKKQ